MGRRAANRRLNEIPYRHTPLFLTYAGFRITCRINMLLIVNTDLRCVMERSISRSPRCAEWDHAVCFPPPPSLYLSLCPLSHRVSIRLISVRIIRNNWRYNEQSGGTTRILNRLLFALLYDSKCCRFRNVKGDRGALFDFNIIRIYFLCVYIF